MIDNSTETITLAVVGAHLRGMPLNSQLTQRNAAFLSETTTASCYRLFALPETAPPKPGLRRDSKGYAIVVELWRLPLDAFGSFVAEVPPPLGIGTIELADGRWVKGFICEPWALEDAQEISQFGGWRAWIESGMPSAPRQ